jgi:hypothetical protein
MSRSSGGMTGARCSVSAETTTLSDCDRRLRTRDAQVLRCHLDVKQGEDHGGRYQARVGPGKDGVER